MAPPPPKSAPKPSDTQGKGPAGGPSDTHTALGDTPEGPRIRTIPMNAEPTVYHRRIAIARDRLETWKRHRAALDIEPGRLEA